MQPEISWANSFANAHHNKLRIVEKNVCSSLLLLFSLKHIGHHNSKYQAQFLENLDLYGQVI